jgi:glutamate 5-kinase
MSDGASSAAGQSLRSAKRLVVKVGSAILCGEDGVRADWLAAMADDIAGLRQSGVEVVVVTSGAIALGRKRLGLEKGLRLDEKQAASAAGQTALAQAWQDAFAAHNVNVAQLLLTLGDTEDRRRYLNARATFRTLLDLGALPIVNENDTVATSEIRYGDNDRLAAHAAQILEADALVILSDVDGVYDADPRRHSEARRFDVIEEISDAIEAAATGPNMAAGLGAGGMASKIAAAKISSRNGCATIIAPGHGIRPLRRILDGGPATLIRAGAGGSRARRQWIGGRLKPAGEIHVDDGAAKALKGGASLLPAGVVRVVGEFSRGDAVAVIDGEGRLLAQGLCAYSSEEAEKVAGRKSEDIEALIGYKRRPAVIEKNDLALNTD